MIIDSRPPAIAPTGLGISLPLFYTFSGITAPGIVEISLVIEGEVTVEWKVRPVLIGGVGVVDVSQPIRDYLKGCAKVAEDIEDTILSCEYWLTGDSANKRVAVYAATFPTITSADLAGGLPEIVALPASSINSGGFTANRQAAAGYTRIDLQVSLSSDFSIIQQTITSVGASQLVTSLEPNETYFYRFLGFFLGQQVAISNTIETETVPLPIPAAPDALPATNVSATSFQANWESVPNGETYFLDVSTNILFSSFVLENQNIGNNVLFNVTDLDPNTQYFYRVRAANGSGTSGNGDVGTATTIVAAPVAVAATNIGSMSFRANWEAVSGATEYRLDVNTASNFLGTAVLTNQLVTGLFFDVSDLDVSTQYFYRVRAVNANGTSANSNTISATTFALPAPVAIAASLVEQGSFRANWNEVPEAEVYRIDVSTDSGFTNLIINNLNVGTNLLLDVIGLTAGTQYFYRVRAIQGANTSDNSNTINVTTVAVPAPVAIAASNITSTVFRANWNAAATAVTYRVDVATDSGFTNIIRNNVSVAGLFLDVTGLTASTQYWYRVRAVNANGTSADSNSINLTTQAAETIPVAPVATAATNVSTDGEFTILSFTANWNAVVNATSYRIDVLDNFDSVILNNQVLGNVLSFNYMNDNFFQGPLKYRVRAVNSAGTSPNSNTVTVNI